jgi:hypothetical protein
MIDLQTVLSWLSLGTSHQYLLLAIAVTGYLTALTSDWSRFPINVSKRWQPAIVVGLGLAYSVEESIRSGAPWKTALEGGIIAAATSGFLYDLVIKGFMNGKVPTWLAWLAVAEDPKDAPNTKHPPKMKGAAEVETIPPAGAVPDLTPPTDEPTPTKGGNGGPAAPPGPPAA